MKPVKPVKLGRKSRQKRIKTYVPFLGRDDWMSDIRMVVGLGNPGKEYTDTRHNLGFKVVDLLAERLNIDVNKRKFGARFGLSQFEDKKLILLKPWQFMNRSGQVVVTVAGFYKVEAGEMLVITDDMALEPGRIRIRSKGSAGGHNGLADVINKLGTNAIARLRIGIGESGLAEAYNYVLNKPSQTEKTLFEESVEKASQAIMCWLQEGINAAMNKFNSKNEDGEKNAVN